MKKIIALLLTVILMLSMVACGNSGNSAVSKFDSIQLTTSNIGNYISISGEYKNAKVESTILYRTSSADLDFQAYSTVPGSFNNVRITVQAELSDKAGGYTGTGNGKAQWHLSNSEDHSKVEFSFSMPSSGHFSSTYSIMCANNARELSGSSKLKIVSVSGTFTPNN